MRKVLAIIAGVALAVVIAVALFVGNRNAPPSSAPSTTLTESVAPVESIPTADADFRKDVGPVTAKAASKTKYPEGDAAELSFVVTNHSADPAAYEIVFAVYDSTKAQVGSILVDTENAGYGPTKPGGVLKVSGPFLADVELPKPFIVEVQSVDRRIVT